MAGGIPLIVPKTDLRPTMDRVKGAIFDSLGEAIIGARVLDLFAGSGALGLEALSRGAASAVMVEKDRLAVETIHANVAKTRLTGATVHQLDIFSYLHRLEGEARFDFIVADPPYAKRKGERDFGIELLADGAVTRALAPGGWFILEKLPGAELPAVAGLELLRERRYGATEVAWFRRLGE